METLYTTSTILPPSSSSSTTITANNKKCAHCSNPSKYTCPRCKIQTCSLLCSRTHKNSQTECTGIRDKVAYIPANKYGWGSLMDDYCFLEDVGRKVEDWGREIVRGGFDMSVGVTANGSGRRGGRGGRSGRGRGGLMRGGRGKGGKGKREMLKMYLEARDIELELLPSGMKRRMLNQSVWDHKKQTALITIQFKFHPSAEACTTSHSIEPFTLLTHRNNISTPLLTLVQKHVRERMNKKLDTETTNSRDTSSDNFPNWIPPLVIPPPEDPENFTTPTLVISAPSDPLLLARSAAVLSATPDQKRSYIAPMTSTKAKLCYSLDPNEPLAKSLRGIPFIEFPLIEVWEEFRGVVVDKETGGIRCAGAAKEEPHRKKRKLDPKEGIKTINELLGDYGSDEEGEEEGRKEEGLGALARYGESEGEEETGQDHTIDEESVFYEDEWSDADAEGELDIDADPAVLLELMRQAKQEGRWEEQEDDSDDSCGQGPADI